LSFRNLSDYFLRYLSTNLIPSTVAAAVVPALGFVACKLKKETLLRVGLIVAAASLGMQLIFMVINIIWSINGLDWKGLSQITRYVNGEDLLTRTVLLFRGMNVLDTLLRIVGSACYVAKNGLVLVACLLGVMKTEK
jgi:hypothetical protein